MRSISLKICLLIVVLVFKTPAIYAQFGADVYFVQFVDKPLNNYSLNDPGEFISQKAIQRRLKSNVSIQLHDLPVNHSYIQQVSEAGSEIIFTTKWMNGVGIIPNNASTLEVIRQFDWVQNIELIHSIQLTQEKSQIDILKMGTVNEYIPDLPNPFSHLIKSIDQYKNLDYGLGKHQIEMLNGNLLHQRGFRGEGLTIAVIDNGFMDADKMDVFDSLRVNDQVISTFDFVKRSEIEYNEGSHGSKVLSIMAANSPGVFIGTAPKANYHLIRTEIEGSESLLEEYLWMCGAEYADSVGADIINSSLGYTVFDDETQNHTYSDLDGNTTIVTRAADMAASKGILVVNSAGNSGNKPWQYIGAPADADSVLSVGAVDENEIWAEFSSIGPTVDDRIKPNIVAQGKNTIFAQIDGSIVSGNGTSFSSPIIAGLAACLWQSMPSLNNIQLLESIEKSGSYASLPNQNYGYGLPDFDLAMQIAESIIIPFDQNNFLVNLYPNPFIDRIQLIINVDIPELLSVNIFDISGKIFITQDYPTYKGLNFINLTQFNFIPSGIYLLQIKSAHHNTYQKIIKID